MTAVKLEERWTPTTIQTAFVLSLPSSCRKGIGKGSGGISIDLPLLNHGWTFALSLTPERLGQKGSKKGKQSCNWIPAAFSFRQQGSAILWGNTSIHAQLSLAVEQHDCGPVAAPAEQWAPHNDSNLTPLGTMNIVLAQTSLLELTTTTRRTLSPLQRNKVLLTVTISECPLANGFFQLIRSGPVDEAKVQVQLARQSGDRLLGRSLATGKLFDVKFLIFSTSSNTGRLLPTYASLSVLQEHIDLSSCEWRCIFQATSSRQFRSYTQRGMDKCTEWQ